MAKDDVTKGTWRVVATRTQKNGTTALRVACIHCPHERWMRTLVFGRDPHLSHRGCTARATVRVLLDRYPVGSVHAIWRVGSIDYIHDRMMALATCVHCGFTQHIRPDVLKDRATHIGCPVAPSSKHFTKRTTRDNVTPSGDSPKWAEWSAMMWAGDPACATWTNGRIENVKAWRSNNLARSRVVSLEERVSMRSDARTIVP